MQTRAIHSIFVKQKNWEQNITKLQIKFYLSK